LRRVPISVTAVSSTCCLSDREATDSEDAYGVPTEDLRIGQSVA
jgi:hypothetical protein